MNHQIWPPSSFAPLSISDAHVPVVGALGGGHNPNWFRTRIKFFSSLGYSSLSAGQGVKTATAEV